MAGVLRTEPRQARSAKTLDQLLDAAERLFFGKGVAETSTVDIAKEAGVSVGRLYYWFPDKDAVVTGVVDRARAVVEEFLTVHLVEDVTEDTVNLVKRVLDTLTAFAVLHPGAVAVLLVRAAAEDPGAELLELIVTRIAEITRNRVPGTSVRESRLVATIVVRSAIAIIDEYLRADEEYRHVLIEELKYIILAYLINRFPQPHLSPDEILRPARPATPYVVDYGEVRPVVIDD